jgi:1-acyl-sn-glycerol-3-phosphate acyltransferase
MIVLIRSLIYQGVLVGSVILFATMLIILTPVASEGFLDRVGRLWARVNLSALR